MQGTATEQTVKKKVTEKSQATKDEEQPKQKKKSLSKEQTKDVPRKTSTTRTPRSGLLKPAIQSTLKPISRMTSKHSLQLDSKSIEMSKANSSKIEPNTHTNSKEVTRSKMKIDTTKLVKLSKRDVSKNDPASAVKKKSSQEISNHSHESTTRRVDPNTSKPRTSRTAKDLPFVNVTVNSPISIRKHTNEIPIKDKSNGIKSSQPSSSSTKSLSDKNVNRERGKTITLKEDEIKVLTSSNSIDNNEEMKKLTSKLNSKARLTPRANPQAFFVDLDGNSSKNIAEKIESDEDSYEDDFENYESDFDSYNSSKISDVSNDSSLHSSVENYDVDDNTDVNASNETEINTNVIAGIDCLASITTKRLSSADEERMLDSGSYELREAQKSAAKGTTSKMDEIREAPIEFGRDIDEDHKKSKVTSMTDEGFIEMSVSGTGSVVTKEDKKTTEGKRPDFIDFKRSRQTKRLLMRKEKMAQRAKDLLSMITLDQISYTLLDIPSISYDIFMKLHGKGNSIQRSIQTNEDCVEEEIQTETILLENKWTQHPVEFSNDEIYLIEKKYDTALGSNNIFEKARLLLNYNDWDKNETIDDENTLKNNPLRIFLDQRNGSGSDGLLSQKKYNEHFVKAKNIDEKKVNTFIENAGNLILKVLDNSSNWNSKKTTKKTSLIKSDWPFSESCEVFLSKNSEPFFYLKNRVIKKVLFSENCSTYILTVHSKPVLPGENNNFDSLKDQLSNKCLICIWELEEKVPRKVLTACDSIAVCVYRGKSDGMVFAALDDGSLCIWDLKEKPFWHQKLSKKPQGQNKLTSTVSSTIADRDRNNHTLELPPEEDLEYIFRTCTFSSSASCRKSGEKWFGSVVSLVFREYDGFQRGNVGSGDNQLVHAILGQLYLLQEYGYITIWSVIRTNQNIKSDPMSVGNDATAYWSNICLNKTYEINLQIYIDIPTQEIQPLSNDFNLISAKRRNTLKRQSKEFIKKHNTTIVDIEGVARGKKYEKSGRISPCNWESGVLCTDLKILKGNEDVYLVARNCGEVIGCRRKDGGLRIQRYKVTDGTNTITSLEISPTSSSYFLAGTDAGTIYLFSIQESRTLLKLNCKHTSKKTEELNPETEKNEKMELKRIWWLKNNDCCFLSLGSDGFLRLWNLVESDINPLYTVQGTDGKILEANLGMDYRNDCLRLAALTSSGRMEIHKLNCAGRKSERHNLFTKYAALL